jgi:CheY-like chemotaxis protein
MKVMIVDDNVIACVLIQVELSSFGHEVIAVESVDQAVATLDADPSFSTVMLDLSVAEVLGGPTVLDRLRATRPERHLPVILHSAMSDDELATRRTRLGADGAFRKGGHLLDLVRQLDRLSESAGQGVVPPWRVMRS